MYPFIDELVKDFGIWKKIENICKARLSDNNNKINNSSFVLTHGDVPGNIIRDSITQEFIIVDWDDLMLAPCERDLWFIDQELLKKYYKDYKRDNIYYGYYLLKRYFQDIWEWFDEIVELKEFNSIQQREGNLRHLQRDYLGWLRLEVREFLSSSNQKDTVNGTCNNSKEILCPS